MGLIMYSKTTNELMLNLYKSYLAQQNMSRIKSMLKEKQKPHITMIGGEWNVWKLIILDGGTVSIGCHPIGRTQAPSA